MRISARMALRRAPLLLLVLVMVALQESCFGASSHSLTYFYTSISEPSQGQPQFIAAGSLDGQVFVRYDSNNCRMKPGVSWMEKVGKEDPQYWDRNTQEARSIEETFRGNLEILRSRYNQSEGLHTVQVMYGCELSAEGRKSGFNLHGYEGRTFIAFDTETLTWVALDPQAQITQRKWDAIPGKNKRHKAYLEEICIEWLEKYLSYQKEALQRTEPPVVTVSSKTEVEGEMETHVCRVDGFFPREIDAFWTRDGEVWLEDTFHTSVAPNADGTYHYWISIQVDPKERGRYRCHVEHDGLQDPLDVELKEPTNSKANLGLITGCIVAVLILVYVMAGIAGIVVFLKRLPHNCKKELTRGSDSSARQRGSDSSDLQLLDGIYACEFCKDESKGELHQFRYDGRTFITFDTETLTWLALNPQAQITHRKWKAEPGMHQGKKANLEKICIECLETYLSCGKEMLQRTGTPKVMMRSRMEVEELMEMYSCHLDDFHPSWERDEKVRLQENLCESVAPDVYETYHYWLSIRIDPKEEGRYWCHVEHEELPEHLDMVLNEEKGIRDCYRWCVKHKEPPEQLDVAPKEEKVSGLIQ
ncbi:BOLA class I histocompatibility antigen, alpha chain BL3-7-like isoform X2 [Erythrolamprus reginae]|uniref:BOLA class I histocompatibility antigen, alpha chain BL3-7-like isoform X2 n=2 Tax=Erythrolamprus reginae TaxID=121349 RepID=UPI00396CE807